MTDATGVTRPGGPSWDDLVSTALIGTERRPFDVGQLAPVTDPAVLAVEGAEASVLAGAAVLGAYRRAGRLPERRTEPVPPPAPDDPRPACSETAAQLLGLILDGTIQAIGSREDLVDDWLTACERTGQRPPDRLLVTLLELGTTRHQLRRAIAGAVGARGAWLGTANPEWRWAAAFAPVTAFGPRRPVTPDTEQWTIGTRAERVALLKTLRAAGPSGALDLLQSTWATEPAAERAAFLEAFEPHVYPDDEPFLEQALDDRAASVRAVAARLLDGLPGSQRAQRMAERARPLVQREGRFRPKLTVALPDDLDAAARRDGITDTKEKGKGVRAGWLAQIVAATPLDVWPSHLGADPGEAVKLARDEPEVLAGWTEAAPRQRDAAWAAALLGRSLNAALLAVLPRDEAVRRLDAVLRDKSVADPLVLDAMAAVAGPWPEALSEHAVERVRAASDLVVSIAIEVLATRLSPAVLPAVESWIADTPTEAARRQRRYLAHALSTRLTIAREFP